MPDGCTSNIRRVNASYASSDRKVYTAEISVWRSPCGFRIVFHMLYSWQSKTHASPFWQLWHRRNAKISTSEHDKKYLNCSCLQSAMGNGMWSWVRQRLFFPPSGKSIGWSLFIWVVLLVAMQATWKVMSMARENGSVAPLLHLLEFILGSLVVVMDLGRGGRGGVGRCYYSVTVVAKAYVSWSPRYLSLFWACGKGKRLLRSDAGRWDLHIVTFGLW